MQKPPFSEWLRARPPKRPGGYQLPNFRNCGPIGQEQKVVVSCVKCPQTVDWAKPEVFNRAGLILDPVGGVDTIMTVLAGSPGEASGLKPGDRITGINGHTPADDPNDPVFNQPAGTILHLTVSRDGTERVYDVTLKDVL